MKKTAAAFVLSFAMMACSAPIDESAESQIDNEQELLEQEMEGVDPAEILEESQP